MRTFTITMGEVKNYPTRQAEHAADVFTGKQVVARGDFGPWRKSVSTGEPIGV
jgi:hypothetical protein